MVGPILAAKVAAISRISKVGPDREHGLHLQMATKRSCGQISLHAELGICHSILAQLDCIWARQTFAPSGIAAEQMGGAERRKRGRQGKEERGHGGTGETLSERRAKTTPSLPRPWRMDGKSLFRRDDGLPLLSEVRHVRRPRSEAPRIIPSLLGASQNLLRPVR